MRRAAVPLLALLLAVGCSSGGSDKPKAAAAPTLKQPPVSAFTAGPCRTMAPDVFAIARDALQLGTTPTPPDAVRNRLKDEQGRIRALQPSFASDKKLSAVVEDFVIAVGVARLAADTNNYKPRFADDISRTDAAVVTACTAGGAATATPSP